MTHPALVLALALGCRAALRPLRSVVAIISNVIVVITKGVQAVRVPAIDGRTRHAASQPQFDRNRSGGGGARHEHQTAAASLVTSIVIVGIADSKQALRNGTSRRTVMRCVGERCAVGKERSDVRVM